MRHGVYQIRNIYNDKLYIGSTSACGFTSRWHKHQRQLEAGCHHSIKLQRACNKYGLDAFTFEILEECLPKYCVIQEQYYLDILLFASCSDTRFDDLGYNICRIAGSSLGVQRSDSTRAKISASQKGNTYCLGRKLSDVSKKKMQQAKLGKYEGEKHPRSKLTEDDVTQIRLLITQGEELQKIAKQFGVGTACISKIKCGRTWSHTL